MFGKLARAHLLGAGAATLGAAFVRSPASAAQFEYKLAGADPVDFPSIVRLRQMCSAIKAETNGRMQITVFPNSTLGSQTALVGQLRLGSVQMLELQHSAYSSVVPATQISSLGFAFTNFNQAVSALDGSLGAYIRKEFAAKGIHVFEKTLASGFRQMTSSTKPIRTVDDLAGFKIRVLPSAIFVDLFKTLGASPVSIDANEMYLALQTHIVDGQENGLVPIESYRVYEVQKYLSITNHIWSGIWVAANADAWNALPPDIQAVITRNAEKYALLERRDILQLNDSMADKLTRQGMTFNTADVTGMRARLGPYFARWKGEFGATAWGLLEERVGRLG